MRDLTDVWNYTSREWGVGQAETYEREAMDAFGKLAEHPFLGAISRFSGKAYRGWRFGQHRIIYRVTRDELIIVAIVHVRSDGERRLN